MCPDPDDAPAFRHEDAVVGEAFNDLGRPSDGRMQTEKMRWTKATLHRFETARLGRFRKSIRVSIEHGEANALSNDYSSTAFWYQHEPHRPFPTLPPVAERMPRP